MTGIQVNDPRSQWVGEEWIRAIIEKDFQRVSEICQPDVVSRLMTPKLMTSLENVSAITQKVEGWYHDCDSIQKEQARVAQVGEKLAIFYRLRLEKNGVLSTIEQQLYCSLREGRIDTLSLLCSGFQHVQAPLEAPVLQAQNNAAAFTPPAAPSLPQAQALLEFETAGGQGSTCALLTPSIKHKLAEMSSGQVLEVRVDDPAAKEDIEAWCRLSGNTLLKMDRGAGQELNFFLMKK
jgi:TusA-related sulfurtransferase